MGGGIPGRGNRGAKTDEQVSRRGGGGAGVAGEGGPRRPAFPTNVMKAPGMGGDA